MRCTDLANCYEEAGRWEEALKLREQVLGLRRKISGPEDLDTLKAMHGLANSYQEAGRPEEALQLREQALSLLRKVTSAEDPSTLWR